MVGITDKTHEHLFELTMAVHRLDAVAGCDQLRDNRLTRQIAGDRSSLPSGSAWRPRACNVRPAAPTSSTLASPINVTVSLAVSSTAPVSTTLPWSITTTWLQVCSTSDKR